MKILLIVPEFGDENIFKEMIDIVNGQKLEINEVLKYNHLEKMKVKNLIILSVNR